MHGEFKPGLNPTRRVSHSATSSRMERTVRRSVVLHDTALKASAALFRPRVFVSKPP